MSTLVSAKPYDEVLDGQKHYRTLLQCTARPGMIGQLDDVLLDVPPHYNRASALIILALFTGDTTYYLGQGGGRSPLQADCDFVRRQTGAKPSTAEHADFLILQDVNLLASIGEVRQGSLLYPETGATVVAQVEAISPAPIPGCLRLNLTGPGIEVETVVFVLGASDAFFETRRERNTEFPMGLDVFLTCDSLSAGPCVLSLPRTTIVEWERI
jgi:alpha-D-ribose 1-methylphosphonate 5-triphosphate synthase subunit PhnH